MSKPYIIVNKTNGKVISRFASLENCTKRCDYLIAKGFPVEQNCTLSFDEAMEKARFQRMMQPVRVEGNCKWY
jgi:hypothetical protein